MDGFEKEHRTAPIHANHETSQSTRHSRLQPLFHFCRRTDRVLITFSETEWGCLKALLEDVLASPGLQPIRDRLSLEYGEI
jgi:hypothetical protein